MALDPKDFQITYSKARTTHVTIPAKKKEKKETSKK